MATNVKTLVGQVVSDIWWLVLLRGIAAILLGLLLFTNAAAVLSVIIIFLGIYWVVDGIITLIVSLIGKNEHSYRDWGIFWFSPKWSGTILMILGIILVALTMALGG